MDTLESFMQQFLKDDKPFRPFIETCFFSGLVEVNLYLKDCSVLEEQNKFASGLVHFFNAHTKEFVGIRIILKYETYQKFIGKSFADWLQQYWISSHLQPYILELRKYPLNKLYFYLDREVWI